MKLSKNFEEQELACPCCGKCAMDKNFIKRLQKARDKAGVPFVITSGYRCISQNQKVGGKADSSHLSGHAVDIKCDYNSLRFVIIQSLLEAGFKRIGIGKNFIHVDDDPMKLQQTIWLY